MPTGYKDVFVCKAVALLPARRSEDATPSKE